MKHMALVLGSVLLLGCQGDVPDGPESHNDDDSADQTEDTEQEDRSLYFYYGPMKPMYAESILYSIEAITGHKFGSWDYTSPDPATTAFADNGNSEGEFYGHCRLLGGCMEHRIPLGRTSFIGTGYVLELERAAAVACYDRTTFGMLPGGEAPGSSVQPIDVIEHQYVRAFSARPTIDDLALSLDYFSEHIKDPEFDDVTPLESAARGHCRVLLTTNRFLFY